MIEEYLLRFQQKQIANNSKLKITKHYLSFYRWKIHYGLLLKNVSKHSKICTFSCLPWQPYLIYNWYVAICNCREASRHQFSSHIMSVELLVNYRLFLTKWVYKGRKGGIKRYTFHSYTAIWEVAIVVL